MVSRLNSQGAKVPKDACKSGRSRLELSNDPYSNEYLVAKFGFDTGELLRYLQFLKIDPVSSPVQSVRSFVRSVLQHRLPSSSVFFAVCLILVASATACLTLVSLSYCVELLS